MHTDDLRRQDHSQLLGRNLGTQLHTGRTLPVQCCDDGFAVQHLNLHPASTEKLQVFSELPQNLAILGQMRSRFVVSKKLNSTGK